MKFISAKYQSQKYLELTPIFKSIDVYIKEWISNNKDYLGNLLVNFLGIKRLKKNLNNCKKIYKKHPEDAKTIKHICDVLRPCKGSSKFVGLITIMQRAGQLEILSNNIKGCFEKNSLDIKNWDIIKTQLNNKKPSENILNLVKDLINIQNEILKVADIPNFGKKLSKEFSNNLLEFVEEASKVAKFLNDDDGYLNLITDLYKIFNNDGEIDQNNNWNVPLRTISMDVGKNIKYQLEEIDKQMKINFKCYKIKSIFRKDLSSKISSKSENPKKQCKQLMSSAYKAIKYVKESFKKLNKKDSESTKLIPKEKEGKEERIREIERRIKEVEKIYNKLYEKY